MRHISVYSEVGIETPNQSPSLYSEETQISLLISIVSVLITLRDKASVRLMQAVWRCMFSPGLAVHS